MDGIIGYARVVGKIEVKHSLLNLKVIKNMELAVPLVVYLVKAVAMC